MNSLPSGTVTFLFTDIEGSTRLLQRLGEKYTTLLAEQQQLLREAFEMYNGREVDTQGDSFFVAFPRALDAINAVVESQRALAAHRWTDDVNVRVRMGLHTGEPKVSESGYVGIDVHRAARIAATAHGGQTLLSQTTYDLVESELPDDVTLRDLGEHRLKDLRRPKHLYQLVIAGLPSDFPPIKSLDSLPNNLPIQLTSFIGRERELREVKELIEKTRLLTLTGVGGTGKTRLALQVAADALDNFHDGVCLVELAPLSDPALVPQATATAFGLREQAGREFLDILKDYLARKNLLLVLDNCEHLIEACAQLADTLLHTTPHLKILATSREALGIGGESTYPVRSLSLPDTFQPLPEALSQYDSVRLFIERAVAVLPNFQVTNQNAPAVAQVCARLDGIPLAIELAAARVRGLGVEQIASRLDDRFRLLTGGSRTALPRQRTLQATIDWSYKLLSEEERLLLRQLSVFAGGWTLEAAEQVCGSNGIESNQILDLLLHLVDKSLVIAETPEAEPRYPAGGSLRYHMLETIRQYAQEKLDEAVESTGARDRHLAYFCALAEQARPHLRSTQQLVWLDRLEMEHDNIRAALAWAQDGGAIDAGLHLATDLYWFWIYRAHLREPCLALENLLAKPLSAGEIQILARGHLAAGGLEYLMGNNAAGHAHAQESEQLCLQLGLPGKVDLAHSRNVLIYTDMNFINDPIRARQALEQNLKLFQEAGDRWMIAHTIYNIGQTLRQSGDFMGARQAHEQSLALFQSCGDNIRMAITNESLAIVAFEEGKYGEARTQFEEALSSFHQMRFNFEMDVPMWILGVIAIREGDYARAKAWYSECLLLDQRLGVNRQLVECLIGFAGIANAERRFERAAQFVGAAEAEMETRQTPLEKFDRDELQRLTTLLRDELGDENFELLVAKGRAMTMEQAIAYALDEKQDG